MVNKANKEEIVIYDIPRNTVLSMKSLNKLTFIDFDTTDLRSKMITNPFNKFLTNSKFYLQGYIAKNSSTNNPAYLNPNLNPEEFTKYGIIVKHGIVLLKSKQKTIAIPYNNRLANFISETKLDVDILVYRDGIEESILNFIKPNLVVIDHSVRKKDATNISLLCNKLRIPIYNISSKGALIL